MRINPIITNMNLQPKEPFHMLKKLRVNTKGVQQPLEYLIGVQIVFILDLGMSTLYLDQQWSRFLLVCYISKCMVSKNIHVTFKL